MQLEFVSAQGQKLGRFVTHRIMKKLKNISKEQDGLTIPKVNIWVHPR